MIASRPVQSRFQRQAGFGDGPDDFRPAIDEPFAYRSPPEAQAKIFEGIGAGKNLNRVVRAA